MAWEDLDEELAEMFGGFEAQDNVRFKYGELTYVFTPDLTRWQEIVADPERHADWKRRNALAARRYLSRPGVREAHNASMRARYHAAKSSASGG